MFGETGFGGSQGVASPGAGFMTGASPSPMIGEKQPSRAMVPVTVKQFRGVEKTAADNRYMIDGKDFASLKVIGQVMDIKAQNTNATFFIDDGTGTLPVKSFFGTDDDAPDFDDGDEQMDTEKHTVHGISIGDYVVAYGKVNEFNGRKDMTCFEMSKLEDMNKLTMHRLEVIHTHLVNTRGPHTKPAIGLQQNNTSALMVGRAFEQKKQPLNISATFSGGFSAVAGMSPLIQRIFAVFKDRQEQDGTSVETIHQSIPSIPMDEIRAAVAEMLGEGVIYPTIDEDHFNVC